MGARLSMEQSNGNVGREGEKSAFFTIESRKHSVSAAMCALFRFEFNAALLVLPLRDA